MGLTRKHGVALGNLTRLVGSQAVAWRARVE